MQPALSTPVVAPGEHVGSGDPHGSGFRVES